MSRWERLVVRMVRSLLFYHRLQCCFSHISHTHRCNRVHSKPGPVMSCYRLSIRLFLGLFITIELVSTQVISHTKVDVKKAITTSRHIHTSGTNAHTFTGRYLIPSGTKQAPFIIQSVRLLQSYAHQWRSRALHKLRNNTSSYIASTMPFALRVIARHNVSQVQHRINGDGSQSSFLVVLSWILHRRHPLHAIIRNQAILPLHTPTQSVFRCKPLSQCAIQSKCHTLRYNLTKIATVRVHQTHIHARLYKPVVPNPVRKHRTVILHFCIFQFFNFPQLHLCANAKRQVAVAIRSCTGISFRLLSHESATSHDISDIPIHAPPVTQAIRVQQTDARQQRAFAYTKVIVDTNARIQTRVPFPFWTIHAKQVMQIQQCITIQCDVTTFAAILTRLIKWRQPVSMPILQQR